MNPHQTGLKVFIAYSSADRELADAIQLGLRGAGHRVFFDRENLPAGESYDAQILEAIERSDLLVFLLGPDSVQHGSYALTELGFARKRWRDPNRRIVPVVTRPINVQELPLRESLIASWDRACWPHRPLE